MANVETHGSNGCVKAKSKTNGIAVIIDKLVKIRVAVHVAAVIKDNSA